MSAFSSYFISFSHAALLSHMITAGSQGHYQETAGGEPKSFHLLRPMIRQKQAPSCSASRLKNKLKHGIKRGLQMN